MEAFLLRIGWEGSKWFLVLFFLIFMANWDQFIAFLIAFLLLVSLEQLQQFIKICVGFSNMFATQFSGFLKSSFTVKFKIFKWLLVAFTLYFIVCWPGKFKAFLVAFFFMINWDQLKGFIEFVITISVLVAPHFYYIKDHKRHVETLEKQMQRLRSNRDRVQNQAKDQSRSGEPRKKEMQEWLDKAKIIEQDVTAIEANSEKSKIFLWGWLVDYYLSYKVGKITQEKLREVVEHNDKIPLGQVESGSSSNVMMKIPTIPLDDQVEAPKIIEEILSLLKDDRNPKIGICGTAGIGKTTIIQHVHNRVVEEVDGFDHILFVSVEKEPRLEILQKSIARKLNIPSFEGLPGDEIKGKIYNFLTSKKYLLILDGMWEELDLLQLGVPDPTKENGCKVILTTRSLRVCNMMETSIQIKVDPMSKDEAANMLRKRAGDVILKDNIQLIAAEIIKECAGVPRVLTIIGKALRGRSSEEEWKEALKVLQGSSRGTLGEKVFQDLKKSYDYLDDNAKKLFRCCSFFPKDHDICIEYLRPICYFDNVFDYVEIQWLPLSKFDHAVEQLRNIFFLEREPAERCYVKMPHLVHNMATWITSNGEGPKSFVKAGIGLEVVPPNEIDWEEIEAMSLVMNGLESLPDEPRCKKLQSLLLGYNKVLKRIPDNFFAHMNCLEVLDLRKTGITSLPSSLSTMKYLRVLLLSDCVNLEDVKYLGSLTQLVHLDLGCTRIKRLPEEMKELRNLRILSLWGTEELTDIPRQLLSEMSNLQKLDMTFSYRSWTLQRRKDSSRLDLEELLCLRNLTYLGISIEHDIEMLDWLLKSTLRKSLVVLIIDGDNGSLEFHPSHLSDLQSLSSLTILNCPNLERIGRMEHSGKPAFPNLVKLHLFDLPKLKRIWEGLEGPQSFQNLEVVVVVSCHTLKSFISLDGGLQLKKLRALVIFDCSAMEEIIDGEVGEDNPLPNLKSLMISNLPHLRSICTPLNWTALVCILVENCPQLKTLPLNSLNARAMKIGGEPEWWRSLQWEDDNAKETLQNNFIGLQFKNVRPWDSFPYQWLRDAGRVQCLDDLPVTN